MPRPLVAAAVASALVLAPAAAAHVVVSPTFLVSGATSSLSFSGPNERDRPMTGFAVTLPPELELRGAEESAGWELTVDGPTATWKGGVVEPGAEALFVVELEVISEPGVVEVKSEQRYPDGTVRWPVSITVVPGSGEGSNTTALVLVGLGGVLAAAAVAALALIRRRAGSSPH